MKRKRFSAKHGWPARLTTSSLEISSSAVPLCTYKTKNKKDKRQCTAVTTNKLLYLSLPGFDGNTNPTQLIFSCQVDRHVTTHPHGTRKRPRELLWQARLQSPLCKAFFFCQHIQLSRSIAGHVLESDSFS